MGQKQHFSSVPSQGFPSLTSVRVLIEPHFTTPKAKGVDISASRDGSQSIIPNIVLWLPHACTHRCVHICTHTYRMKGFFKKNIFYLFLCMSLCAACVCSAHGGQKVILDLTPHRLSQNWSQQAVVSFPVWVLKAKPGFSERAVLGY